MPFAVAPHLAVLVLSTARILTATRSLALISHGYCTRFVFCFKKKAVKVNGKTEPSLPAPSAAADPAQRSTPNIFLCGLNFHHKHHKSWRWPREGGRSRAARGTWRNGRCLRSLDSPCSSFPKGLGRLRGQMSSVVGKNSKAGRTNLGLPV